MSPTFTKNQDLVPWIAEQLYIKCWNKKFTTAGMRVVMLGQDYFLLLKIHKARIPEYNLVKGRDREILQN